MSNLPLNMVRLQLDVESMRTRLSMPSWTIKVRSRSRSKQKSRNS